MSDKKPILTVGTNYREIETRALLEAATTRQAIIQAIEAAGGRVSYIGDEIIIEGDIDPHSVLALLNQPA